MGSSIGRMFMVTTFGESHGGGVGAVVEGCPSRLELAEDDIQKQLDRRRPGQSKLSSPRKEKDSVRILSGVERGLTLGTPIALLVANEDARPGDYAGFSRVPRPSHADLTYALKYGITAASGGGRASARETVARVAAGSVAEKFLTKKHKVEIVAWVSSVGGIDASDLSGARLSRLDVDDTAVRCPDEETADKMEKAIEKAASAGDSLGGIITCVCRNVPAGWGEPVFEKMEAMLGMAMLSIPAAKGFEIGSGFAGSRMKGSEHNDLYVMKGKRLGTVTNRSGGVQGGISNGELIVFRVAFKPVATIKKAQKTADLSGKLVVLENKKGRHDPCVLPRAVPVVESMAAIVLADMALRTVSLR